MHGKTIVSPNVKEISNVIHQNEYFDEEILKEVNNKFLTPEELNNEISELNPHKNALYMHLNISSLSYHHEELYNLISDFKIKPKIIGISESKLMVGKQPLNNISLPNYVYEHTPTESNKGGTLLYLDKTLKYKTRKDLTIYQPKMIESTFVEIMNKKTKNMIVGCIYKHPKQGIKDFTDNYISPLLEKISHEKKDILIMGDFNINLLNYNHENQTTNFLDTMYSYSLLPFITSPTRITSTSKTTIDNIFYNKPIENILAGNISSLISDHLIQFIIEPIVSHKQPTIEQKFQRSYKNFDSLKFKHELSKIDWNLYLKQDDPNISMENFLNKVNELLDKHAPCKEKKQNNKEKYQNLFKAYRNKIVTLLRISKDSITNKF